MITIKSDKKNKYVAKISSKYAKYEENVHDVRIPYSFEKFAQS